MKTISFPWRFAFLLFVPITFVLAFGVLILLNKIHGIEKRSADIYTAYILSDVRLKSYVSQMDDRNKALGLFEIKNGLLENAISYCKDICRKGNNNFCDSLILKNARLSFRINPISLGVHSAVCDDIFEIGLGPETAE